MLHSFSVTNFFSFKEKQTISFEAAKAIDDYEDHHVVKLPDGTRLRKLGIVYGANASGKSNLVNVFTFLKKFWVETPKSKTEQTGVVPFLLDDASKNKPTDFEVIFYAAMHKYRYTLTVSSSEVLRECLYYYPGIQPALIFDRTVENGVSKIKYGGLVKLSKAAQEQIEVNCLPNMSFAAAYHSVNVEVPEIYNAVTWMAEGVIHPVHTLTNLKDYVEGMLHREPECKTGIVDFLKEADFNIADIMTSEIVHSVDEKAISLLKDQGLPQSLIDKVIKDKSITVPKTDVMHRVKVGDEYKIITLPLDMQSDGTKRMLGLSGALFIALQNEGFLSIDEIESKLHPKMITYVIESFLRQSNEAQLLLTTHYDNLFDEDELLRKDNFWFTEKQEDASTLLYPLTDFNELNRISSLRRAYSFGRFGAVPELD